MDNLKEYIQQSKEQLDTDDFEVSAEWIKVKWGLKGSRMKVILFRWSVAASFLILIAGSVFLMTNRKQQAVENIVVKSSDTHPVMPNSEAKQQDSLQQIAAATPVLKKTERSKTKSELRIATKAKKEKPLTALDEMSRGFEGVINTQLKTIRATPFYAANENYFVIFKRQLSEIDQMEKQAKAELANTATENINFEGLINIYQLKIQLLKQLQSEIDKMNNRAKQADPDITTGKKTFINI
jgi:hypothetical protein